ncbi:MAG: pyruvate:ferredoxin (flavodoxin) oxidoreductase, partial [Peptococcaceae bacterium]|nr:pyruvate:ferredoxin (flavodoxin) oxidoreductase [Peptococcaceae bacterium]
RKNIFGQTVNVVEMQSEAGAAGTIHGSLAAGALTSTYTASQGLLLMLPTMYKIAGELLPCVFHVTARTVATHALSIFGDQSDVMACRQTGFAMLASSSVQEAMDLGAVAHLATLKSRIPFIHFFDGFRTSHEIQKIEVLDYDDLAKLVDYEAVAEFRKRGLNPNNPIVKGTAQNPDIFFQAREAVNPYYGDNILDAVDEYMAEISKLTGRTYLPFNYYGAEDAEEVVIAMGSVCEALEEVVDYLNAQGKKVGLLKVRLYRPFSAKHFMAVMPESVKRICVLDRTKEPGALGEPLYEDVRNLYYDMEKRPMIIGGRYGLGSKDVTPAQLIAVYENLAAAEPKRDFTIGINDDVTFKSLPVGAPVVTNESSTISCKFWGYGSDGTVGANKDAIKIIGDNTDMYAQGYFSYDSKKSGGVTISHLRFGKDKIRSTYLIDQADYIACHKPSYIEQYEVLEGLKPNGTFLLNCPWKVEELDEKLPAKMKRYLAENNIRFYIIDAVKIAGEVGLGGRINMVTQAAFFKLSNVLPYEQAVELLKGAIKKTYGKKGDAIVQMNWEAVDKAEAALVEVPVPAAWAACEDVAEAKATCHATPEFITKIVQPMNAQQGDKLPVSCFVGREDGSFPLGTSRYEKRMAAISVPEWIPENCIQCNQCSLVCPHAAIRPVVMTEEEAAKKPENMVTIPANGKEFAGMSFRMQVSPMDCLGCGSCVQVCPAKNKALVMKDVEEAVAKDRKNWIFATHNVSNKAHLTNIKTIKGSQFSEPLMEFSGACAGCGETPYAKLITQLFGDHMMIANATGCSSIWGASAPSMPYCTNSKGRGPAWANSLFENNAEFGFGMLQANLQSRARLVDMVKEALTTDISAELKDAFQLWLDNLNVYEETRKASDIIIPLLENADTPLLKEIATYQDHFIKRSQWVFGGDGWAYDIGYGGLDHVLASGENINIMVFDTEVYSNTGGQASKSTPTAAIAKFAASGKKAKKKDLGLMNTIYGNVYVAQIALGANMNQAIKAITEAEAYDGPSLIIAYATCINHGIKGGLSGAMQQMKQAVESGYWHLWRYNPELKAEGKNPFILDSKEPDSEKFREFINTETRYTSLAKMFPEQAEELFAQAKQNSVDRYQSYVERANK